MNKRLAIAACSIATLALSSAWATTTFNGNTAPTGAHYRNGSGEPTCTVSGLTVSCGGTRIAGVGNIDADLILTVTYAATVKCRNHGGQIVEVKTQTTSTGDFGDATEVKNGTLNVAPISLAGPSSTQGFLDQASCPNGNWTKELFGSPTVTSFTYTLTFFGFSEPAITFSGP